MKKKRPPIVHNKKNSTIDLQQFAIEYSHLLNKEYCYLMEDNSELKFQFREDNFFHLLGLHKLKDVSVSQMVNLGRMKKSDFYKGVKNGKITWTNLSADIQDEIDNVVNYSDTSYRNDLGVIKAHRFAYFKESIIEEVLLGDPVIDFDASNVDTDIEDSSIFYKFIAEKDKNLNLFIGYDVDKTKYYVNTYFLEMNKDKYRKKADGEEQLTKRVLSRSVKDMRTNQLIEFTVKWENVRSLFIGYPEYRAQKRLKTWIKDKHIRSLFVEQELKELIQKEKEYNDELAQLEKALKIATLVEKYFVGQDKDNIQLDLFDYNIDMENEADYSQYKDRVKEFAEIVQQRRGKLEGVQNKIKNYQSFLPDLKKLEIMEIKRIYQPFYEKKELADSVLEKLMQEERNPIDNKTCPKDFVSLYEQLAVSS